MRIETAGGRGTAVAMRTRMNLRLALMVSLPLLGCVVGQDTAGPGSGSNGSGSGSGSGSGAADHITASTTWSGNVSVDKTITVDAGATLTIAAGTTVTFGASGQIKVLGTVDVQGTKAQVVKLSPTTAGAHHYGFSVPTGGTLKMAYAVQVGGPISVDGGKLLATDTRMSQAYGDFLMVSAGMVDVTYSAIGLEPGAGTDTTHCDMHFGGAATVRVSHSNISTSSYGLMLYAGTNVNLTYNNWFSNSDANVDTQAGVSADVSNGWFDAKGAPTSKAGVTIVANNLSASRVTDAGPR